MSTLACVESQGLGRCRPSLVIYLFIATPFSPYSGSPTVKWAITQARLQVGRENLQSSPRGLWRELQSNDRFRADHSSILTRRCTAKGLYRRCTLGAVRFFFQCNNPFAQQISEGCTVRV